MTITPVKEIPRRGRPRWDTRVEDKPIKKYLTEFMEMGVKYARLDIEFYEYSDWSSALSSIRQAINFHRFPIDIRSRDHVIYLVNRNVKEEPA